MLRSMLMVVVLLLVDLLSVSTLAYARASLGLENPFAPHHIEGLPHDIRRTLYSRAKACGNRLAAAHYFSLSIEANGQRFISLHFEEFSCQNRSTICRKELCLHEVYLRVATRSRLVFRVHARDLKLIRAGNAVGLEVSGGSHQGQYRWNDGRFVRVSQEEN